MGPEHALADWIVLNSLGHTLFTRAIRNALERGAPTARSSCASPLRGRAASRRGNPSAGLMTSNGDNGTSSVLEGPALLSHGNGHLVGGMVSPFLPPGTSASITTQGLKECPIHTTESDTAQHPTRGLLQRKCGSVPVTTGHARCGACHATQKWLTVKQWSGLLYVQLKHQLGSRSLRGTATVLQDPV